MSVVLIDIFDDIVDSMRETGSITNLAEAGGITTVTSANSFSVNDVVTMDSVDYVVLSASSTQFTVMGTGLTASSWAAKAPHYLYGHPLEMVNTLLSRDGNDTLKYQKYPLIYLVLDIKEKHRNDGLQFTPEKFKVVILTRTNEDYTSVQRKENVFEPILIPLYNDLMQAIKESIYFDSSIVDHEKEEKYFWGTANAMGSVKNILNDPIDAIEIEIDDLGVFEERFNNKC